MDTITNRHKGKRFIVGGYSPHVLGLDKSFLDTGIVIGVNKFCANFKADYFLGCDTGLNWEKYHLNHLSYKDEPKFFREFKGEKFMRTPNQDTEAFVPSDAGTFFDELSHLEPLLTEWTGKLQWVSSSAMAAVHLAVIMGASEIILWGVDFVGNDRADGSQYPDDGYGGNFWDVHISGMNDFLRKCSQYATIYKVNELSKLEVRLWQGELKKMKSKKKKKGKKGY